MGKAVIFDWIGTLYQRDIGPFPRSKEVLEYFTKKGYILFLVSLSKDKEKREKEIDSSGLKEFFKEIIIDNEKTEDQYRNCMNQANASPRETLIVDDRTVRGIAIGNKLGCQTYWIQEGEYANELPNEKTGIPARTIKSVSELLDYVAN